MERSTSAPESADSPFPSIELSPLAGSVARVELVRAENARRPRLATSATLRADGTQLECRFECEDEDAWSSHQRRDAPLWEGEVVELFIAPGTGTPRRYVEIEVAPNGAVFDAIVHSPHGDRRDMTVDVDWDCPDLEVAVGRGQQRDDWWAGVRLPWRSLLDACGAAETVCPPTTWRLNLYRIDRSRRGDGDEHSAWSPTWVEPADFHRPVRFGALHLLPGRS